MAAPVEQSEDLLKEQIRSLTLLDFLEHFPVTTRFENCLKWFYSVGHPPFHTIGEYLDAGESGIEILMKIPNLGKRSLRAFNKTIHSALFSGIPPDQEKQKGHYSKQLSLADHIEKAYPETFSDLLEKFRQTSDNDPVLCATLEGQLRSILKHQRWAEISHRRFHGDTLDAIANDLSVTRENIRIIEKRFSPLVTNICTEGYLRHAVSKLAAANNPPYFPSNKALSGRHRQIFSALRTVFLKDCSPSDNSTLKPIERALLADKFGLTLGNGERSPWTVAHVIDEIRAFAKSSGKPDLMPLQKDLIASGRQDLRYAIARFGGQSSVAELAGLIYQGQQVGEDGSRTYWTDERIHKFLHEVARKEGHAGVMPSQTECRKHAPNPNTIIAILTRGGWYGKGHAWFDLAKKHGFKYSRNSQKVSLHFIRAFVESLGNALYSLTPAEIFVLFEQQGINKSGRNAKRKRTFDNLVTAIQSGYLPKEEMGRWIGGKRGDLVEALLDPDVTSIEDAFASVGRPLKKQDHKKKADNLDDAEYREDVETHLPTPSVLESLSSLERATDLLVHTSSDAEAVQFLIDKAAGKLWRRCFENEQEALEEARRHQGNTYSEAARDRFLEEYTRSKQLPLPPGYAFRDPRGQPCEPKLMQRLIAYKVLKDGRVLNLSGTGTGKTLSAVLASRVIGARVTVIACPNTTTQGWRRTICSAFPDSDICEKTWNPIWSESFAHRYLIMNHEMFQNRYESRIKAFIEANEIDLVVIDELHQVKQRDESFESQRRRLLNGLITDVPAGRPKPRVLGLSATPIINNLQEGKSLIELVSSLEHHDLGTDINVQNCMKLYQKFTTMGFRMMPRFRTDRLPKIHPVDCTPYIENLLALGHKPHPQQIEAILVRARWPVIKQYLQPKTVIFTDYVKDIIPYLVEVVGMTGLSVGIYTGEEKLATEMGYVDMLDQFIRGKLDVLVASIKTVGTGVDGLQFVCNNVVFATLPWTNTDYEQAIGRFDREGFQFDTLDIHIPKTYAVLCDGQEWSWCDAKLSRIENKRGLAKAAVDGEIPDTSQQLTPERASAYWMGWLKRLAEEGLAEINRREIKVPLDDSDKLEVERRYAVYGDFSNLNARWNIAHSSTTHTRLQENPEEWCYYHSRMLEQETTWQIIPRNECIKHLLENLPRGSVVGDFGCGQAQLAAALQDVHTVYSLDHVAIHQSVMACDFAHSALDDSILDAAVFSLSLMGSNLRDYIAEAYRTLKIGGHLIVYHPAAGNNLERFVRSLDAFGFAPVKHGKIYKWLFVWAIKKGRQVDAKIEISF